MLYHVPVQFLEDHRAVHRFYRQVLFILHSFFFFSLGNVCVWEPYKLFEGVNFGESGGAVDGSGLGAGDTDCADCPKRK